MKQYQGTRIEGGKCVVEVIGCDSRRKLNPRLDLSNHSPTGFEWGYGGSGPAQLALALLADVMGDDDAALRMHQHFKFMIVSRLPRERWHLSERDIRDFIDDHFTGGLK